MQKASIYEGEPPSAPVLAREVLFCEAREGRWCAVNAGTCGRDCYEVGRTQRDATMVLVAYRHGLRPVELVTLRWDAMTSPLGKIHVSRAKNGSPSVHPLARGAQGPRGGGRKRDITQSRASRRRLRRRRIGFQLQPLPRVIGQNVRRLFRSRVRP